jgi:hypothetical protein
MEVEQRGARSYEYLARYKVVAFGPNFLCFIVNHGPQAFLVFTL